MIELVDSWILWFTQLGWEPGTIPDSEHNIRALLAIALVCFICGATGALVVGNRMAFFSDSLAHCAFAGIALGALAYFLFGWEGRDMRNQTTPIMIGFGIVMGLLIAYVRESTGLANDTVIGVFYAAAVGLGAMFTKMISSRQVFNIESFIFGDPTTAQTWQILALLALAVGLAVLLAVLYNPLVLASANPSLARSRRVSVRLNNYLFIVLLAILVNLSLLIVGTLLINGLLIVPAATAANLARNLRQMFWYSIGLAVFAGLGGFWIQWEVNIAAPRSVVGTSGTIVVLAAALFGVSMVVGPWLRNRKRPAPA